MQPSLAKLRIVERETIKAVRELVLQPRERLRAEARCRQLLAEPAALSEEFRGTILADLTAKRLFVVMEPMAERLIAEGDCRPTVYKAYAQALIENGKTAAARCVLAYALSGADQDPSEWQEMCGLMGRVHKQSFVDLSARDVGMSRRGSELNSAIDWYMLRPTDAAVPGGWESSSYHAVNVVALESRARRDGIVTQASGIDLEVVARRLLQAIEEKTALDCWDCAIAAEACLALNSPAASFQRWISQYAHRNDVDTFGLASMLRQFCEIWQIKKEDHLYGSAIAQLEAALFERQGGAIDLKDEGKQLLESVETGERSVVTLQWLAKCMERTRSVGQITTSNNFGTGFLVKGSDLVEQWGPAPVFLTNSHVTGGDDVKQMTVRFHGTKSCEDHRVTECLRASPPDALDYAVLRLADVPEDAICAPIKRIPPSEDSTERVYVMGHPDAGEQSVSLYNNKLVTVGDRTLHYTAATQPGSSGSPVFNEDWEAVGLHHGVTVGHFLDGVPYSAHEGIKLGAIMDQAKLEPKSRWPRH